MTQPTTDHLIRLEPDVFEAFQKLTSDLSEVPPLIHKALREWLVAQGVKDLIREEVANLLQRALSTQSQSPPLEAATEASAENGADAQHS